jgi:hypothetical protein
LTYLLLIALGIVLSHSKYFSERVNPYFLDYFFKENCKHPLL